MPLKKTTNTKKSAVNDRLEALVCSLNGELSDLTKVKLLPKAKALYEELFPQTRHGGDRRVASSATCPDFSVWIAGRTGVSRRTIYNRLETAAKLTKLDAEAEAL